MANNTFDAIVIGAGFYGLRIALYLREKVGLKSVLVLEKELTAMEHASYVNQARVHQGYHYPRSILTGYRSAKSFDIFVDEYKDAVVSDFNKYYGIARILSKVNGNQFEAFCQKINAPCAKDDQIYTTMFNPTLTEAVYKVKEYAFNSRIVRAQLLDRINTIGGIEIRFDTTVEVVSQASDDSVEVVTNTQTLTAERVFNCTYAQINNLHRKSGLELLALKHEITEMCLVELPEGMKDFSITMMDGPFFSIMPFPSRGLNTLSHVRYTPHFSWLDNKDTPVERQDTYEYKKTIDMQTNFSKMYADVIRFIPALKDMKLVDVISEVKTVLVKSENDDSRPILFRSDFGIKGYTCIMGGKLDNIYDAFGEVDLLYGEK